MSRMIIYCGGRYVGKSYNLLTRFSKPRYIKTFQRIYLDEARLNGVNRTCSRKHIKRRGVSRCHS